ncbi:hypothetical protein PR003_g24502 [Phytophthora rubi]|uniref:Uncharacterized protein n=1 Tax=Phytophthora rubi TaxID=129364 RepID=A0A6A4CSI9_9STRA|nr:hypothetical protein PR002_g17298 [Phytophthora rubi]KAE9020037.1 hypothetical protein PR001_g13711 [Phytophthora rubi]KAE9293451.1 hypothetical protein PR003_g24502 [Phytophthora rubi]
MPRTPGKQDITPQKRVSIGLYLAGLSSNGRLPRGSKKLAMQTFKICRRSNDIIWKLQRGPGAMAAARRPYSERGRRITVDELGQTIAAVLFAHGRPSKLSLRPLRSHNLRCTTI